MTFRLTKDRKYILFVQLETIYLYVYIDVCFCCQFSMLFVHYFKFLKKRSTPQDGTYRMSEK